MSQLTVDQAFARAMQFHGQGRAHDAETLYRQIIAAQPSHADAHHLLGLLAYQTGNADAGIQLIRRAIELQPGVAAYHSNLGNMLCQAGRAKEAIVECRRAVALDPNLAAAYNNLGIALAQQRETDEAIDSYERALAIHPDYPEALNNLGNAQRSVCLLNEAVANFRRAMALSPDDSPSHHDYLFTLHYLPDYEAPAILAELQRWADRYAPEIPTPVHRNDPDPNRRLRVAYLCANFGDHVHALFHAPLLSSHDRRQVEVFGYSNVEAPDAVTARLRGMCDHWRDIFGLPDEEVARLLQADAIDILVDEVMHMVENRLLLYARKPVPVQMTWLAYPGTTGLPAMQYRITDPFLDPPGTEAGKYSEESIRLPDTFLCYGPPTDEPVRDSPVMRNGFITFGGQNNFSKVNDGVLGLWTRLLARVTNSRLLMTAPAGRARQRVLAKFASGGIAAERIEFVPFQSRAEYLATYHRIDIALDTFPYNGYTTSLDAFWMGVPVLTRVGHTVVGRATWSALNNLRLPELAATDDDGFVERAAHLAGDLPRLINLRMTMRDRMRNSPLTDAPPFARNFEAVYRELWQRWCARQ
ncbi:tetratricopeptide repeat protein [soil metagenome]